MNTLNYRKSFQLFLIRECFNLNAIKRKGKTLKWIIAIFKRKRKKLKKILKWKAKLASQIVLIPIFPKTNKIYQKISNAITLTRIIWMGLLEMQNLWTYHKKILSLHNKMLNNNRRNSTIWVQINNSKSKEISNKINLSLKILLKIRQNIKIFRRFLKLRIMLQIKIPACLILQRP